MTTKKTKKTKTKTTETLVEPTRPTFMSDETRKTSIHEIRMDMMEAAKLTGLLQQYALEAILYARDAMDLDPSDFTAAAGGYFDDDDDAQNKLVTGLVAILDWSAEVNGKMERAVREIYDHDPEAKSNFDAASAKWDAEMVEYNAKKAAFDAAKRAGGKS